MIPEIRFFNCFKSFHTLRRKADRKMEKKQKTKTQKKEAEKIFKRKM